MLSFSIFLAGGGRAYTDQARHIPRAHEHESAPLGCYLTERGQKREPHPGQLRERTRLCAARQDAILPVTARSGAALHSQRFELVHSVVCRRSSFLLVANLFDRPPMRAGPLREVCPFASPYAYTRTLYDESHAMVDSGYYLDSGSWCAWLLRLLSASA